MKRPPYAPGESIFARGMGSHILWVGPLMGLISLGIGLWGFRTDNPYWQTMVFTTLTLSQMGHALSIRSNHDSLFKIGLLSNKYILGAVSLTFVLQLLITYLPFGQELFNIQALPLPYLIVSLLLSTIVFWAVEMEKWVKRRKPA
jgi:Ca2+-transporting ATPase